MNTNTHTLLIVHPPPIPPPPPPTTACSVEEQAIDRVHRIGQKKEVTVLRFVMQGSIEERILELQEKKKHLATAAMSKATDQRRQERIDDLRMLFGFAAKKKK